jgi:hypothetical protein
VISSSRYNPAVPDNGVVELADVGVAAADLVSEDDAQLGVDGFEVPDLGVGGLPYRLLQLLEVPLIDDVVVPELPDAPAQVVGACFQLLVLGDDPERPHLLAEPDNPGFGHGNLGAEVCRGADDLSPDGIVDGLAELGAGRLPGGEVAVASCELPVEPEQVRQVGRGVGLRLAADTPGRLVEGVGGDPAHREGQERPAADSRMIAVEAVQRRLEEAVPFRDLYDARGEIEDRVVRGRDVRVEGHYAGLGTGTADFQAVVLARPVQAEPEDRAPELLASRDRALTRPGAEEEVQQLDHARLAGAVAAVGGCRLLSGVRDQQVQARSEGDGLEPGVIGAEPA